MLLRLIAISLLMVAASSARAQEARGNLFPPVDANGNSTGPVPTNAWIDLRQTNLETTTVQKTPPWVEAVHLVAPSSNSGAEPKTVFRVRLAQPQTDFRALLVRLFFDDMAYAQPEVVAWDETGAQVIRSGPLGSGVNLPISDTIIVPTLGTSAIDVEVPGDGSTVRGIYLDWMTSSEVARPASVDQRDLVTTTFNVTPTLRAPAQDSQHFGTVTATLAAETIRIGVTPEEAAGFEFQLEAQPLLALLTFEVATPEVEAAPRVVVNGNDLGPAALVMPDLADPGYRGKMQALVPQMQFQYTGWMRAQKIVPATLLRTGTNDVFILNGGSSPSAVRATQIQLKYMWEKADYLLKP